MKVEVANNNCNIDAPDSGRSGQGHIGGAVRRQSFVIRHSQLGMRAFDAATNCVIDEQIAREARCAARFVLNMALEREYESSMRRV